MPIHTRGGVVSIDVVNASQRERIAVVQERITYGDKKTETVDLTLVKDGLRWKVSYWAKPFTGKLDSTIPGAMTLIAK